MNPSEKPTVNDDDLLEQVIEGMDSKLNLTADEKDDGNKQNFISHFVEDINDETIE